MANEEVVMTVKAEISPAKKQVEEFTKTLTNAEKAQKELNEQISIQNKVLNDLEKELVELKATQDSIPKGAFYAGMGDLNKKIKETEKNIKLEKLGLKDLQNQQKENNRELKEQNKELKENEKLVKEGIGNFRLFGVSINDVNKSLGRVIPTIKVMFASITRGIMSTGIGALLIAFGSLATYFTSTKRGADALSVAFAGIGAAVNVLRDRFSQIGETLLNVFNQPFSKTLLGIKDAFTGITEEVTKEVAIMTALEKRVKALRDAEIEFTVQRAETRKEIEKARLLAEDETQTQEVRIEALKKALDLEKETVDTELKLARERVAIQEEQMATAENKVDAEKQLADFRSEVLKVETRSLRLQKRVQTEINELERELHSERMQRLKELQDANKKRTDGMVALQSLFEQQIDKQIDGYDKLIKASDFTYTKQEDLEMSLRELAENRVEWAAMTENERLNVAKNTLNDLGKIAGEETELGKALAITQTTISTYQSAQDSYASLAKIPVIGTVLGSVAAAAAIAMGMRNIQAIRSAGKDGVKSTGGVPTPSVSSGTPAPEMLSGRFELTPPTEQQPVQAYVVTDDLTENQNKLAYIRRRATI
jgi:chromosome segregation ATPase